MLSEVALLHDGAPVNNFEFLRPVIEKLGFDFPAVVLPVPLAQQFAQGFETLHNIVSRIIPHEPFLTRAEVFKVGVTHYMSIDKARRCKLDPSLKASSGFNVFNVLIFVTKG